MRSLLKLAYSFTTLVASFGARGFKPRGFTYFLRQEIDQRKEVLEQQYRKAIEDQRFAYIQNGHDHEAEAHQRKVLEEFKELDDVLGGRARKRLRGPAERPPTVK